MMHILIDALRNSIMITGLVVIMMMIIESLNIESKGLLFKGLKKTKFGQVLIASLLGSIPGCMGGFAVVSLYTHKIISFGALVAMMIASSGDEAFAIIAMAPDSALPLFALLFVIAIVTGILVDIFFKHRSFTCNGFPQHPECQDEDEHTHHEHSCHHEGSKGKSARHFGWKRIVMTLGLAIFIASLASGHLGHDHAVPHAHGHDTHHEHAAIQNHATCHHGHDAEHHEMAGHHDSGINLLDEQWMNILFAGLSVIMLIALIFASDHFVQEHLWNHIVKKHLPVIFAWTFGVLLLVGLGNQYLDISGWLSDNTAILILLAALIGIIPESGPHLAFVTLFANGTITFPVLLASCISQDGHASIPLLAESKKSFLWAKIINCAVALIAGYAAMLIC